MGTCDGWGMVRLPAIRLHRRGLADLDVRVLRPACIKAAVCLFDVFAGNPWGSSISRRRTNHRETR